MPEHSYHRQSSIITLGLHLQMTPGIDILKMHSVSHKIHQYTHSSDASSYGLEAAEKMGVATTRVFKTLIVKLDNKELAVAIIPVSAKLSMKGMAKAAEAKKAMMASSAEVERSTGYVLGGVSPLGQKQQLKTVIDVSACEHLTIYVSAGRRGVEIELSPTDLNTLVNGKFTQICQ